MSSFWSWPSMGHQTPDDFSDLFEPPADATPIAPPEKTPRQKRADKERKRKQKKKAEAAAPSNDTASNDAGLDDAEPGDAGSDDAASPKAAPIVAEPVTKSKKQRKKKKRQKNRAREANAAPPATGDTGANVDDAGSNSESAAEDEPDVNVPTEVESAQGTETAPDTVQRAESPDAQGASNLGDQPQDDSTAAEDQGVASGESAILIDSFDPAETTASVHTTTVDQPTYTTAVLVAGGESTSLNEQSVSDEQSVSNEQSVPNEQTAETGVAASDTIAFNNVPPFRPIDPSPEGFRRPDAPPTAEDASERRDRAAHDEVPDSRGDPSADAFDGPLSNTTDMIAPSGIARIANVDTRTQKFVQTPPVDGSTSEVAQASQDGAAEPASTILDAANSSLAPSSRFAQSAREKATAPNATQHHDTENTNELDHHPPDLQAPLSPSIRNAERLMGRTGQGVRQFRATFPDPDTPSTIPTAGSDVDGRQTRAMHSNLSTAPRVAMTEQNLGTEAAQPGDPGVASTSTTLTSDTSRRHWPRHDFHGRIVHLEDPIFHRSPAERRGIELGYIARPRTPETVTPENNPHRGTRMGETLGRLDGWLDQVDIVVPPTNGQPRRVLPPEPRISPWTAERSPATHPNPVDDAHYIRGPEPTTRSTPLYPLAADFNPQTMPRGQESSLRDRPSDLPLRLALLNPPATPRDQTLTFRDQASTSRTTANRSAPAAPKSPHKPQP